ncbi:MAG: CARDB domain-containing protein [Candidatus Thermoplasmatota archaeon]
MNISKKLCSLSIIICLIPILSPSASPVVSAIGEWKVTAEILEVNTTVAHKLQRIYLTIRVIESIPLENTTANIEKNTELCVAIYENETELIPGDIVSAILSYQCDERMEWYWLEDIKKILIYPNGLLTRWSNQAKAVYGYHYYEPNAPCRQFGCNYCYQPAIKFVATNILIDRNDSIHLLWVESTRNATIIWYKKLDSNGNIQIDNKMITTNTTYDSTYPYYIFGGMAAKIDSSDNIHIIWLDALEFSSYRVYYIKSDTSGNILNQKILVTTTKADIASPMIDIDSNDNIHIVWNLHNRNETVKFWGWQVYYAKINNNGEILINATRITYDNEDHLYPKIAVDAYNNPNVIWSGFSPGYMVIDSKTHNWTKKEISIFDSHLYVENDIAIDSDNNIHILMFTSQPFLRYIKMDSNKNILVNKTFITSDENKTIYLEGIMIGMKNDIYIISQGDIYSIYYMHLGNNGTILLNWTKLPNTGNETYHYLLGTMTNSHNTIYIFWGDSSQPSINFKYSLTDLTISDTSFSTKSPKISETIVIDTTIRNAHIHDIAKVLVHFYDNDEKIGEIQIDEILAGEDKEISTQWNATKGRHIIRVVVDPDMNIPDFDTTNNEMNVVITVKEEKISFINYAFLCTIILILSVTAMILFWFGIRKEKIRDKKR